RDPRGTRVRHRPAPPGRRDHLPVPAVPRARRHRAYFLAGVTRLLPGEYAVISPDGRVTRQTYTTLYDDMTRLAAAPAPYDAAARERIATALRTAIRTRLVSDVPVGTALSGGLDSSTIVATIDR